MPGISRRDLLAAAAGVATAASAQSGSPSESLPAACSLDGEWQFQLDPPDRGARPWDAYSRVVTVPHTWQIEPDNAGYMGVAWYRREFDAPAGWASGVVRIEFEAVFHSATVSINGREAGRHAGKGYTAFEFDISPLLRFGARNHVVVRVDNAFSDAMLPRGRSSDWTHDGGINRPVRLLVTPKTYFERVAIDAVPDLAGHTALVEATAFVRNASGEAWSGTLGMRAVDLESGLAAVLPAAANVTLGPGETRPVRLADLRLSNPKLWHFDHPHLYRLDVWIAGGHRISSNFGVRSISVEQDGFYLNGERVRLMGVERMAGSNPEFGMAEPESWLVHDHHDMKELNCVYTRVHWPQDRRVLDYCDHHGILIQTEVPTWGPGTFAGMGAEPSPEIMQNGLEQLREMIARDRNHPSLISWGLCNEINGQNPPAFAFARRMYEEARRLDPRRLLSYASHSLFKTPGKDVAALMDFIEFNEYYGSWQKGGPADLERTIQQIHAEIPGKAIVISEYGYCACTPDRPEDDARRADVLREHDRVFRGKDYIAGLIFFCYNDYRTHVGDKGLGVARQRVHGVVDIYGNRKTSWEPLREQSSPLEVFDVSGGPNEYSLEIATRNTLPAYRLRGYKVRGVLYGRGAIPLERVEAPLPDLAPGESAALAFHFRRQDAREVRFDILRPTGFSVATRTLGARA